MESLELKEVYMTEIRSLTKPLDEDAVMRQIAEYAKSLNFPEVSVGIEEVKLAGGFLKSKKADSAVVIRCEFKKFKKLRAFFRVLNFGNVGVVALYSTTSASFFDRVTSKNTEERLEAIISNLSDVALVEYFQAFNQLCIFILEYIMPVENQVYIRR